MYICVRNVHDGYKCETRLLRHPTQEFPRRMIDRSKVARLQGPRVSVASRSVSKKRLHCITDSVDGIWKRFEVSGWSRITISPRVSVASRIVSKKRLHYINESVGGIWKRFEGSGSQGRKPVRSRRVILIMRYMY